MSQQYDNKLSGVLFKNDKTKSSHPDYRGSIEDDTGREFWVSAWIKDHRTRGKYLSLALTPKDNNGPGQQRPAQSDADSFLAENQSTADKHRRAHADQRSDMRGGPQNPSKAADFDSFDDDIPF
jgi:hypothetical protein